MWLVSLLAAVALYAVPLVWKEIGGRLSPLDMLLCLQTLPWQTPNTTLVGQITF